MAMGLTSASNRNEYQKMVLADKVWAERKTDNLTVICEPNV
jgi:hypothetical protein